VVSELCQAFVGSVSILPRAKGDRSERKGGISQRALAKLIPYFFNGIDPLLSGPGPAGSASQQVILRVVAPPTPNRMAAKTTRLSPEKEVVESHPGAQVFITRVSTAMRLRL
jgi:hypothetical protein